MRIQIRSLSTHPKDLCHLPTCMDLLAPYLGVHHDSTLWQLCSLTISLHLLDAYKTYECGFRIKTSVLIFIKASPKHSFGLFSSTKAYKRVYHISNNTLFTSCIIFDHIPALNKPSKLIMYILWMTVLNLLIPCEYQWCGCTLFF